MATPKIDLFSHPHKEQRLLFCALSASLSKFEATDEAALSMIKNALNALIATLHDHALSEDTFIIPLLKNFSTSLEEEHQEIDVMMAEVGDLLNHLCDAKVEERDELVAVLYRTFNRFMGHYFLHLDKEETQVMPFLWRQFTPEEIVGVIVAFKAYKQPEKAEKMLPNILKAMTKEEQNLMFISIRKYAPQAAYEASLSFAS